MRRLPLSVSLAAVLFLLTALLLRPLPTLGQPLADAPPADPPATETVTATATATATSTVTATAAATATPTATPTPTATATPDHLLYLPYLVQSPAAPLVAQPGPDDGGMWTAMRIVSLTDGWLGTSNGSLYHLVNERPQKVAQLSAARITSISVAADGSLWAVTEAGEVLQGDSAGWRVQASLGAPVASVSAVLATDVWLLKDWRPWRWDGVAWGEMAAAPLLSRLVAVSASGAWGTAGNQLWRWDGASWSMFKEFGGMWIDDLAAWPDGQVWVVGTDPRYPFYDPRRLDGARLLWSWNGTNWGYRLDGTGWPYLLVPARLNQHSGALCTASHSGEYIGVSCYAPLFAQASVGGNAAPVSLGMVTPYDGWALTDTLYRVHISH